MLLKIVAVKDGADTGLVISMGGGDTGLEGTGVGRKNGFRMGGGA